MKTISLPSPYVVLLTVLLPAGTAWGQGTAFTYQGFLQEEGAAANGAYAMRFTLESAESGAGQVGAALTNLTVAVSNGLFKVVLDFGGGV